MAKLEDSRVIEEHMIKVNDERLGRHVHALINIYTKTANHKPYLSFVDAHNKYMINNYKISGDGCYLLECKFPSNERLDQFLVDLNEYANYKLSIVIKK